MSNRYKVNTLDKLEMTGVEEIVDNDADVVYTGSDKLRLLAGIEAIHIEKLIRTVVKDNDSLTKLELRLSQKDLVYGAILVENCNRLKILKLKLKVNERDTCRLKLAVGCNKLSVLHLDIVGRLGKELATKLFRELELDKLESLSTVYIKEKYMSIFEGVYYGEFRHVKTNQSFAKYERQRKVKL